MNFKSEKIKKTTVKGYKIIKQLVGIDYFCYANIVIQTKVCEFIIPELKYIEKRFISEKTLEVFEGDLSISDNKNPFEYGQIYLKGQKVDVLDVFCSLEEKIIEVDIHIKEEDEEQEFNKEKIIEGYNIELEKTWLVFKEALKEHPFSPLIRIFEQKKWKKDKIMKFFLRKKMVGVRGSNLKYYDEMDETDWWVEVDGTIKIKTNQGIKTMIFN